MKRYHLRRADKEITDTATLTKVMKSAQYVTIAMAKDNQPYLVSLSHGYDEARNCIYFHCADEGKKLDYLRANGSVWGQAIIDGGYAEGQCTHLYASVQFSGKVTLLGDVAEKRAALECMVRQLDNDPEKLIAQMDNDRLNRTVVGRIDIDYMSGKKSKEIDI
jgi:hypothetical protein